jgi:hypothetical protein
MEKRFDMVNQRGIGGIGILDYQEFVADGATTLFLTNANYDSTSSIFVTVNGEFYDARYRCSQWTVVRWVKKHVLPFSSSCFILA